MQDYSGRGPRNYHRSDERILDEINDQLTRDPRIDASDIEVRVNNGEVTLSGTVDHRNDKRLAEDIAESCSGVQDVQNQIRVKREGSGTQADREVPRRTENESRTASGTSSSTSQRTGTQSEKTGSTARASSAT
jgi:hypothetical protein